MEAIRRNKSKLIQGIICLVIAGGLAVANMALLPETLMFQVDAVNMPWVPPVALEIMGIASVIGGILNPVGIET